MNEIYETLVNPTKTSTLPSLTSLTYETPDHALFLYEQQAFKDVNIPLNIIPNAILPVKKISKKQHHKHVQNQQRITSIAEELIEDLSITFMNNSPYATARLLQLQDLSNGELAANNSWVVSAEIFETASASMFGAVESDLITLTSSEDVIFSHSALCLTYPDGEGAYVLDFTARQYDETLLFPYVASVSEWQETISKLTKLPVEASIVDSMEFVL